MPSIDNSFISNHTCLRVKDAKASIAFYERAFGMKLIGQVDVPAEKFTNYALAFETPETKNIPWSGRPGVLELNYTYGSENNDSFQVNNGNGEKDRGFGHICVAVDNIQQAESELLSKNVQFKKKLSDGRQKNIAFVLDPDGYWIELIEHGYGKKENFTDPTTYKLNHTMIRVKDPKKSLEFYTKVLGFKLFSTRKFDDAKFTLYFLGYEHSPDFKEDSLDSKSQAARLSVLELTHNWGTESDDSFEGYHNGNSTENGAIAGYGHFGIACKDSEKFCQEIESEFGDSVQWEFKYNTFIADKIGFIQDPDGYSIEIFSVDRFD